MKLIILAAGEGTRLRPLTAHQPKCMVPVSGRPIIERLIETAGAVGLNDIVLVGGYRADALEKYGYPIAINSAFDRTNMVRSLFAAEAHFGDGFVLSYGDIFYTPEVLRKVLQHPGDIAVAVDTDWRRFWQRRFANPLDDAETLRIKDERIVEIGNKASTIDEIEAQYIGLLAFRRGGVAQLRQAYAAAIQEEAAGRLSFGRAKSVDKMYMTDLLQGMADRGIALSPARIAAGWAEIDSPTDLALAEALIAEGRFGTPS
jgi:L-glutamine-phosphate cytidylyltransferase